MQSAYLVLRLLEVSQFIPDTLLDEDTPRVLFDDRLLVLEKVSITTRL